MVVNGEMPVLPSSINLHVLSTVGFICMALIVFLMRARAAKRPATVKRILMPPIGMSTGFLMFLVPETHIPLLFALVAFLVGIMFSLPLIRTTRMEVVNEHVYVKPSKAFPLILFGLLVIRIVLHDYVQHYISVLQTASVFFILAFGMLGTWRLAMYCQFRKLERQRPWRVTG